MAAAPDTTGAIVAPRRSFAETLAVYCKRRVLIVMFLGFSSGLPLALSGSTLLIWMTEAKVNLGTIGLFVSTLTEVPIAAMASALAVAVISEVLAAVPQLHAIAPWLFSHYWLSLGDFLREPIRWDVVDKGALLALAYIVVFGLGAWARFSTKDISS